MSADCPERRLGTVGVPDRFYLQLSLEHMRIHYAEAIHAHLLTLESEIKLAVEELCTVDRVALLVKELTVKYVREAVDQEIKAYFTFGPGRTEIKKQVEGALGELKSLTRSECVKVIEDE